MENDSSSRWRDEWPSPYDEIKSWSKIPDVGDPPSARRRLQAIYEAGLAHLDTDFFSGPLTEEYDLLDLKERAGDLDISEEEAEEVLEELESLADLLAGK